MPPTNPFRFGAVVRGDAFTDRADELAALVADLTSGQDAVVIAGRRFGKTSLGLAAAERASEEGVAVAYVDLMLAASKERLAGIIAGALARDVLTRGRRGRDRVTDALRRLTLRPQVTVDESGRLGFSFAVGAREADIDRTLDDLLELPGELAGKGRRIALMIDELPVVTRLDSSLLARMRAIFQAQSDVAHVYLGSERAFMERVFTRENEPFYRAARALRLGPIPPDLFAPFLIGRFVETGIRIEETLVRDGILARTGGHPHNTQAIAYFLWHEAVAAGGRAGDAELEAAFERLLDSDGAHWLAVVDVLAPGQRLVLAALARESGRPLTKDYRARHGLASESAVQKALAALAARDLIARAARGLWRIEDPLLQAWLLREEDRRR